MAEILSKNERSIVINQSILNKLRNTIISILSTFLVISQIKTRWILTVIDRLPSLTLLRCSLALHLRTLLQVADSGVSKWKLTTNKTNTHVTIYCKKKSTTKKTRNRVRWEFSCWKLNMKLQNYLLFSLSATHVSMR